VATAGGRAKGQAAWTVPPSPQHPVSVIAFNGALDLSIPLEGGWQKKKGVPAGRRAIAQPFGQ